MSDSGRVRASVRRARGPGMVRRLPHWRLIAALAGVALAGSALTACGTANASSGPVTLNFYFYPDTSTATDTGVTNCNEQSHGKYTISYQVLPVGLRRPAPGAGQAAGRA